MQAWLKHFKDLQTLKYGIERYVITFLTWVCDVEHFSYMVQLLVFFGEGSVEDEDVKYLGPFLNITVLNLCEEENMCWS